MKSGIVLASIFTMLGSVAVSAPVRWSETGHFYEIILGAVSWEEAAAAAASMSHGGQEGYLATITSASEHEFLDALYDPRPSSDFVEGDGTEVVLSPLWIGASDSEDEGIWRWMFGPEAGELVSDGFEFWEIGEPNDFGDGEDFAAGWFRESLGYGWNDLPNDPQIAGFDFIQGYIVEFNAPGNSGGQGSCDGPCGGPNVVPLPASGGFVLAGMLAMAVIGRRRSGKRD